MTRNPVNNLLSTFPRTRVLFSKTHALILRQKLSTPTRYAILIAMMKKIALTAVTLMTALTTTACAGFLDENLGASAGGGLLGGGNTSDSSNVSSDDLNKAKGNIDYLFVNDNPAPPTKYSREAQFGSAWTDNNNSPSGHNGCDTRNDILNRDLVDIEHQDSKGCVVLTGTLEHDPYTGRAIDFRRGRTTSAAIQIDHVVALSNAWTSGAWQWTQDERVAFANDPANLIAADGPENNSKSDKAADKWLVPNNPAFRCAYATKQVNLKASHNLTVTTAEKNALKNQLAQCG